MNISPLTELLKRPILALCGVAVIMAAAIAIFWRLTVYFEPHFLIVIIGDSITDGKGDDTNPGGGFVGRLRQKLDHVEIISLAYPGKTSLRIYELSNEARSASPDLERQISTADLIIFAGGINDYWDAISPRATTLRLRKVASEIRKGSPQSKVVVASLILPTEDFHNKWAFQTNRLLMSKSFMNLEHGPSFHTLPPELLSADGLHPKSEGYDFLSEAAATYICNALKVEFPKRSQPIYCLMLQKILPNAHPTPSHQ